MDILIVGYGFVGRAHEALLRDHYNVHLYDQALGYNDCWKSPNGIIICVSTPAAADGSCDMSNVVDTINYIDENTPILIKSTISLEGWHTLKDTFPNHDISFSPEFLRAATAEQDFRNTSELYIGGNHVFWHNIFGEVFTGLKTKIADVETLILGKYFRNSFLATKVAFFNQIYDLCQATGVDYEAVADIVGSDSRIGTSHTTVTEDRGFGGHCFPKDVKAIIETANKFNTELTILEEASRYNTNIRKE